jgi:predicted nucleic acid-binding protein
VPPLADFGQCVGRVSRFGVVAAVGRLQLTTPGDRRNDAIHLGTALRSRSSLTSFVTYDKRLLDAAQAAGLPIDAPA